MNYDTWKTTEPDPADFGFEPPDHYGAGYDTGWQHGYESANHDRDGGPYEFGIALAVLSAAGLVGFIVGWLI